MWGELGLYSFHVTERSYRLRIVVLGVAWKKAFSNAASRERPREEVYFRCRSRVSLILSWNSCTDEMSAIHGSDAQGPGSQSADGQRNRGRPI